MGYQAEVDQGHLIFAFDPTPFENPLTKKQMDVLELLARGLSNNAIAKKLQLSPNTIKHHVGFIKTAFHIQPAEGKDDRTRLAVLHEIVKRGLVHPRDMLPENYNEENAPHRKALSPTEFQILCDAVIGKVPRDQSQDEKGRRRAPQTVKNHLGSAYRKLRVGSLEEAFGIVLNASLEGIDLTEANGERFGEYELVDGFVVAEPKDKKKKPEYILLPEGEMLVKFLDILGKGGIAVVAYDGRLPRGQGETEVKWMRALAAFAAKDAPDVVKLAQEQPWLHELLDGVESWATIDTFLKNMGGGNYWRVEILHGDKPLDPDQTKVLRRMLDLIQKHGKVEIPENVWRLLPAARRARPASLPSDSTRTE